MGLIEPYTRTTQTGDGAPSSVINAELDLQKAERLGVLVIDLVNGVGRHSLGTRSAVSSLVSALASVAARIAEREAGS